MFRTTAISVLAVTMALSAPGLKAQLLDLDADVDLGSDGLSVDAGANVGGSDGLSLDADAAVGGSDGVNVDAGANVGGADGLDVDTDASLGGDDGVDADVDVNLGGGDDGGSSDGGTIDVGVDADVTLGGSGSGDGNGGNAAAPDSDGALLDADVDAAILDRGGEGGRVADLDVVIGLIEDPAIDGTDIDATIDDTRVAIIDIADTFGPAAAADIEILADSNGEQQDALQAAVAASAELGSILGREGVPLEAVVALDIGSDGRAAVYVLGDEEEAVASVELSLGDDGAGGGAGDGGTGGDAGGNGDGGPGADGGNGGPDAGGGDDGAGSGGADDGDGSTTPGAGPGALVATVAALPCPADLEAFVPEGTVDARLLGEVNAVSVIAITGCPGATVSASAATGLHETLRERSRILAAIRAEGYTVSDVVGATANDETLVVYVIGS